MPFVATGVATLRSASCGAQPLHGGHLLRSLLTRPPRAYMLYASGMVHDENVLMNSKSTRGKRRAPWLKELAALAVVVLVTTVVFWATDLDIRVARIFYAPGHPGGAWPYFDNTLWHILYASDDYLTAALSAAALGLIAMGAFTPGRRRLLRYGLFILLSGLLGTGLLTNLVFKEYWGHPRPDNIVQFGGELAYLPPLAKGIAGEGESFPSGHVSIAFSYIAIWFILRRKRPRAAALCLIGVVALTCLEGLARMVRGRHFLSDVLWGAYIPYIVCFVLYYFVFRFHTEPDRRAGPSRQAQVVRHPAA
jgi:lipid A 4'-phosphatase